MLLTIEYDISMEKELCLQSLLLIKYEITIKFSVDIEQENIERVCQN